MSENLPARLRVGDVERDRTVERLATAYADGQLTHEEFEERSSQAYGARFADDLAGLVADLGAAPVPSVRPTAAPGVRSLPAQLTNPGALVQGGEGIPLSVAVMSGTERVGTWTIGDTHTAVAVMGGVVLDLREATFSEPVSKVSCLAIMGGIDIIVPPWVRVRMHGLPIMGGFGTEGEAFDQSSLPADAPVLEVTGLALMGGVCVTRTPLAEMLPPVAEAPAIER